MRVKINYNLSKNVVTNFKHFIPMTNHHKASSLNIRADASRILQLNQNYRDPY